jgi:hypothetical protein
MVIAIPQSRQEVQALRVRRSDLSSQLTSATERRNELAERIKSAEGVDKAGLEQRVALLDRRILQLEADIATTGQALTAAPAQFLTGSSDTGPRAFGVLSEDAFAALTAVFFIFVLAPMAIGIGRGLWRRARTLPVQKPDPESAARLERIEQAVDAIAIEVERISEGQRFTTRLLAAGQAPAEPIPLAEYEGVRATPRGS